MGKRTLAFKKRLKRKEGIIWAKRCWKEMKKTVEREGSEWKKQRKNFYMKKKGNGEMGKKM